MQQQRVAAVDIGSNTVHMVVGDLVGGREFTVISRRVELLRLGADVAATGAIGEARAARTEQTLREMAAQAQQLGAITRLGLATEGVRAAHNAQAILARFSAAWGEPIALVTGMEEAALTFWGATSTENDPTKILGVGDLGGGSCELVVGTIEKIAAATSLPLGSGQLVDLAQPADPPSAADIAKLRSLAHERMQTVPPLAQPLAVVLGVGGTATALARVVGATDTVTLADLDRAIALLVSAPSTTLAAQTGTDVERLRLLIGGVVAWQAILLHFGREAMQVSERGVREGAILAWAQAGAAWQHYAHEATA
jgi:exopolyphosphatase/guanosine-5'-triphosphate,3'-diphosphate pyrophosphatase